MPFSKENAAGYGRKGGKVSKPPESVRNRQLKISLTPAEFDRLGDKAEKLKLSKAELVVRAVDAYDEE